jgi:hypothetical protein
MFLFLLAWPQSVSAISITPPRLELSGDAGQSIVTEFKITNDSVERQTYYIEVQNFVSGDESGNPQFLSVKENLATWIDAPASVSLAPSEQKAIPVSINVPAGTEPGGYFAAILVSTSPPPAGGNEVSIGARLGTLVLLRVNGQMREGVDILEFSTLNKQRLFTSLPVGFYYRFQNSGADRVKPEGSIVIKNLLRLRAKTLDANRTDGNVLPESIRRFDAAWLRAGGGEEDPTATFAARSPGNFFDEVRYQWSNFALGFYTADLNLTYGEQNQTASRGFWFLIIPWQLLFTTAAIIVIVLVCLRFALKRYNSYIISQHKQGQ